MSLDHSLISRFALPQTSAEWEQFIARYLAVLAKVPANRWQFVLTPVLVFVLSVSLARLFWLVFPTPVLPPATIALPTVTVHVDTDGQSINIAQLKALPVFGKFVPPAAKQDAPAVIESQAVDTHLNLVLVGIMGSNEEKASRAVIASGDKQDVYAIGDALPVGNGVTLSKVMVDRVIINNNGQYESLWLYSNDPNAKAISKASYVPPPLPASSERTWASGRGAIGPEMPSPERGGDSLAEVSLNLSDVLAMSIYRENGQVVGYKIRPGRDAEKFKSLGLQADDVVTSVNGMPLTDPTKIMEVYKSMGNTTSASLEIKRGGSVITVNVVLQN